MHTSLVHSDPKLVRCRFEKTVVRSRKNRVEVINHLHPVVRFIGKMIDTSEEKRRPAIAVKIYQSETGIDVAPGHYVFTIQKWSVQGLLDQEKLDFRVMPLAAAGGMLSDMEAEQLVMCAAAIGQNWVEVHNEVDLERAAELSEEVGLATSEEIYRQFVQDIQYRNEDRADLQERSLDRHLESQLAVLKETLAGHIRNKTGLDKATEGKINKLKNRVERRRMKIRDRRIVNHQNEDICVGLIKVI